MTFSGALSLLIPTDKMSVLFPESLSWLGCYVDDEEIEPYSSTGLSAGDSK